MPVQPDFSIEARIPEDADSRKGIAPDWCDLQVVVEQEDNGPRHLLHLTRGAGEALRDAIGEVLHPWAGMSIIEHIWSDLDDVMNGLMDGSASAAEDKGMALGLATALARLYNPLDPNVDAVREMAMERWEASADDDVPFA